ncbi:MAG: TIM barrel protein [Acidobacteria bacterium]|nr:TIM barrel protein [Acidobacteriota bacterium]
MQRRELLKGVAGLAVGSVMMPRRVRAQKSTNRARVDRIAIMSLGFDRILKRPDAASSPERTLDLMDIGELYADRWGVHNVELQHGHLLSTEDSWLREFRAKLAKSGSKVTNINLEFGAQNMSAADLTSRLQAVDLTKRWIDHAVTLGSPRVMVNQGAPTQENKAIAIAALKAMGDYGRSKGVKVGMENRGAYQPVPGAAPAAAGQGGAAPSPSATPVPQGPPAYLLLVEIIKAAGTYANCDMGNFPDQQMQHAGMRAMLPLTDGNTHVKINPLRYDLPAGLALARELGYTGLFSIEANTPNPNSPPQPGNPMTQDPYKNQQIIYDVLVEHI